MRRTAVLPLSLSLPLLLAPVATAQTTASSSASASAHSASTSILTSTSGTTTAGASRITASSELKLAKTYVGQDFMDDFDFFTDDDPTAGYVNYVSKSSASSNGLVDVQSDNTFIMRADYTNVASGRGRDSVRISSKDKFADGVYILDLNHMPVGCGTWPAWWTVVSSGWPTGGEIDIIEGVNGLPSPYSSAWNSTTGISSSASGLTYNAASLHTSDTCTLGSGAYMTGTLGSTQCSAYLDGNNGCGVDMTGYTNGSYGAGFNGVQGGWYALWRDWENSGGAYVYYWPRDSNSVPDDVKNADTATTNVADWGQPAANLSAPTCKDDFGNHVIVFDLTFCGDYGTSTYTSVGCPSSCTSFVMNYPAAFSEAYWSLNSLRVYTASGKAAGGAGLSKGAIAGIVIGAAVVVVLAVLLWLRIRSTRRQRRAAQAAMLADEPLPADAPYTFLAGLKPRIGPTKLAPGKTARHFLDGETPTTQTQMYAMSPSPAGSTRDLKDPSSSNSNSFSIRTETPTSFVPATGYVPASTVQPSPARVGAAKMGGVRQQASVPEFNRVMASDRPYGRGSWVG